VIARDAVCGRRAHADHRPASPRPARRSRWPGAELERGRKIEQGLHPDREPFAEPRDTKKMDDEEAALFQRDGKGNAVPPRTR